MSSVPDRLVAAAEVIVPLEAVVRPAEVLAATVPRPRLPVQASLMLVAVVVVAVEVRLVLVVLVAAAQEA